MRLTVFKHGKKTVAFVRLRRQFQETVHFRKMYVKQACTYSWYWKTSNLAYVYIDHDFSAFIIILAFSSELVDEEVQSVPEVPDILEKIIKMNEM